MTETSALTVVAPQNLAEAKELSATLAASRIIPEALQKSPADVLAIVMTGLELGLKPMAALRGLVIVKGKVTMSADTMHSVVLASGACEYVRCLETTSTVAKFAAKRRGQPEQILSFSMEDARTAGLISNATYQRFPAQMLRARALAGICRLVFPDVLMGLYETGEIQALESTPAPAPTPQQYALKSPQELDISAAIDAAQTVEDLQDRKLIARLSALPEREKTELRAKYGKRLEEIRGVRAIVGEVVAP